MSGITRAGGRAGLVWVSLLAAGMSLAACAASRPGATLTGSGTSRTAVVRAARRPEPAVAPTAAQRRRIIAALWSRESGIPSTLAWYRDLERNLPGRTRRPVDYRRLRMQVVRIRVSPSRPVLAIAAVRLRDRRGRPVLPVAITVLSQQGRSRWSVALGPATLFPASCVAGAGFSLRELLCPSPWRVLGLRPPRSQPGSGLSTPVRAASLREVDWKDVSLPGVACGASHPIRLHRDLAWTESGLESWGPEVSVYGAPRAQYGELGPRQVALLSVTCTNGGGTADGQLQFAAVVYTLTDDRLHVAGVITPRQPASVVTPNVPILSQLRISANQIIASEAWYGPRDSTAAASGRARTVWKLTGGVLRPVRTVVVRAPAG